MFDLVVVGAGPAGSTAARIAAGMGLKVLILEKEKFPRYKPCGGALSERATSWLDLRLPEAVCEKAITGLGSTTTNGFKTRSRPTDSVL